MRRSFRAATVFTGVAAITGGLGPTALAASRNTITPLAVRTVVCGANNGGVSQWLHVFYPNNDHPAECAHGSGTVPATGTITAACGGAVSAILSGTNTVNGTHGVYFIPSGNNNRRGFSTSGLRTNLALSRITVADQANGRKCTS